MSAGVDIDDDYGPAPHDPERDREIVMRHVAQLREHFDAVEICAVRHLSDDDGTAGMHFGGGNWYARVAIVAGDFGKMRLCEPDSDTKMEVDLQSAKGSVDIQINPRYLLGALGALPKGRMIAAHFGDDKEPTFWSLASEECEGPRTSKRVEVVMPVRK